MTVFHLIVVTAVLIAAFAQMLLKKGAAIPHKSIIFEYLNPWVVGGYSLMFVSMILDIYAIGRGVQIKEVSVIESLSYLFVPLLGFLFFRERMNFKQLLAVLMIIVGIILFFL